MNREEQFAHDVLNMLNLQQTFFRSKDHGVLERCKALERQVKEDAMLILTKQPKLFE